MDRWKAAGLHLLLSLLVVGSIAVLSIKLWYPYGLYRFAGPDRLLFIMLGIDLTAGPLLTLVIFKRGKPSLRFDLACIALFQLAFLGYGAHTLWSSRPVLLVGYAGRFNLVFANEIDSAELVKAPNPAWRRLSWTGPVLVGALPPTEGQARQNLLFMTLGTGIDVDRLPRYYVDYPQVAPQLLKDAPFVPRDRVRSAGLSDEMREVPVVTGRGTGWMWLDARTGQPMAAFGVSSLASAGPDGAGAVRMR